MTSRFSNTAKIICQARHLASLELVIDSQPDKQWYKDVAVAAGYAKSLTEVIWNGYREYSLEKNEMELEWLAHFPQRALTHLNFKSASPKLDAHLVAIVEACPLESLRLCVKIESDAFVRLVEACQKKETLTHLDLCMVETKANSETKTAVAKFVEVVMANEFERADGLSYFGFHPQVSAMTPVSIKLLSNSFHLVNIGSRSALGPQTMTRPLQATLRRNLKRRKTLQDWSRLVEEDDD